MRNVVVIFLALAITGCATSRGFDRGSLRSELVDQKVISEADIKNALELKPQLPAPFKLAIYFAPPKQGYRHGPYWNWAGDDKDTLLVISKELKSKHVVSDVFTIGDAILEGTDNKAIRLAAARAGADAVIIVNGVSDIDRYNNALGVTYVLLITPLFVPGTNVDALFIANASMWDVRNQYLYLSAEAEGSAKKTGPAFLLNQSNVVKAAKHDAVTALAKEISNRLTAMTVTK